MYFVNPNNQRPLTNKFKQHMLSWRIQMSVLLVAVSIFSNRCGSTVTSTGICARHNYIPSMCA